MGAGNEILKKKIEFFFTGTYSFDSMGAGNAESSAGGGGGRQVFIHSFICGIPHQFFLLLYYPPEEEEADRQRVPI